MLQWFFSLFLIKKIKFYFLHSQKRVREKEENGIPQTDARFLGSERKETNAQLQILARSNISWAK